VDWAARRYCFVYAGESITQWPVSGWQIIASSKHWLDSVQ
jgi:hypothetical protein